MATATETIIGRTRRRSCKCISYNLVGLASAASPSSTRTPFPLYANVIQVIQRYLNVQELANSIRLSKEWHQALKTAKSLQLVSNASVNNLVRMPSNSTVARHITRSIYLNQAIRDSHNRFFPGFSLMSHLGTLLPNLKQLHVLIGEPIKFVCLPPQLEIISVEFHELCRSVSTSIGQLKYLRDLQLCFHGAELPNFDYLPLLPLVPRLESLTVSFLQFVVVGHLSSLAEFVQQPRIRSLSLVVPNSDSDLKRCYRTLLEPMPGETTFALMEFGSLTSIDLGGTSLDGAFLQVLTKFPALTNLSPRAFELRSSDVPLLALFPKLTELRANRQPERILSVRTSETIAAACQHLPNLRTLYVSGCAFTTEQLDECLSHLPCLTAFALLSTQEVVSLAPLIKYNLPERITSLTMDRLSVAAADLRDYILQLTHLTDLHLYGFCIDDDPSDLMDQMRALPYLGSSSLGLSKLEKNPPAGFGFGNFSFKVSALDGGIPQVNFNSENSFSSTNSKPNVGSFSFGAGLSPSVNEDAPEKSEQLKTPELNDPAALLLEATLGKEAGSKLSFPFFGAPAGGLFGFGASSAATVSSASSDFNSVFTFSGSNSVAISGEDTFGVPV